MSDATKEANQRLESIQESIQARQTVQSAQQSDNVAHALAGAGGGLLSMTVTYASFHLISPQRSLGLMRKQISFNHAFYARTG